MILYFSATGNNKYIAETIAEAMQDTAVSIETIKEEKIEVDENECLGIVVPTYFLELPVNVAEFLRKIDIRLSKNNYVFGIVTYGSTSGASGSHLKCILKEKDIKIDALYSIITPDTWTIVYDLSDKKKVSRILEKTKAQLYKVIEKIINEEKGDFRTRRIPYLVTSIYDPLYNRARNTSHFHVEDNCIGCVLCERNCPAKAIKIDNGKPIWVQKQCIGCLRCIHSCPKFAIQYGNKTKSHGQYRLEKHLTNK